MARRMGPQDSATSHAILDATEEVLGTRGYGAITSRSVAEAAGVRQQLIYYYFQTVDEMLLVAFQRRMARGLERLEQNIAAAQPLRAMWNDFSDAYEARIVFEYMALANHHEGIRDEVRKYLEKSRAIQVDRLAQSYAEKGVDPTLVSPEAVIFLINAINLLMAREIQVGVTSTHAEVLDLVERFLARLD